MQDKKGTDVKKILLALADHLKVKGLRGLAERLGIKENTLYAWIKRGRIGDTATILDKCPTIRLAWLESGEGEMFEDKFKAYSAVIIAEGRTEFDYLKKVIPQVPVLGRISAGFPNIAQEEIIGYISPPEAPSNSFALKVSGDCMEPSIKNGDYVLFIQNGEYAMGNVLVVLNEWGEATLKRLKEKEGVKYLVPDNPAFPAISPNEHFRIVGKVVKVWRDVRF